LVEPRAIIPEGFMFSTIDTEEKAYWLGFLVADGCITAHKNGSRYIKLSLSIKDKKHLDIILKRGIQNARSVASETVSRVKSGLGIGYGNKFR